MATSIWMSNAPAGTLVYLPGVAQPVTIAGPTDQSETNRLAGAPGLGVLVTGGGSNAPASAFGAPTTLAASSASILANNPNGLQQQVNAGNVVILSG